MKVTCPWCHREIRVTQPAKRMHGHTIALGDGTRVPCFGSAYSLAEATQNKRLGDLTAKANEGATDDR